MNSIRRTFAAVLSVAMLFAFFSCGEARTQDTDDASGSTSANSAAELFSEKADQINAATDLKANVKGIYEKKTGDAEYNEKYEYTLEYFGIGTESFAAYVSSETVLEKNVIRSTEIYRDGEAIYEVSDEEMYYCAEMSAQDYRSRHIPAVILDPVNYQTVTYDADKMEFAFSDAHSHERWIAPEYAELVSAEGRAVISDDGGISEMYYEAEYVQGAVHVNASYTVIIGESTAASDSVKAPKEANKMPIDDIDTAIAMKYAYAMLDAGFNTNGTKTEYMLSQAAGMEYTNSDVFASYGKGEQAMAILSSDTSVRNTLGASAVYEQEILHRNGITTYSTDGSDPEQCDITLAEQLDMIDDALRSNVYDMRDMLSITTGHLPDYLIIDFKLPDKYGEIIEDAVSETLFGDVDYLDSYATAYTTSKLAGYLCIDKDTGFIVASGVEYTGEHTISDQVCQLLYISNSKNETADPSAYTAITGDPVPDVEPEHKATPLFYKVTSSEGNTMYLLGTIHIGDDRTAYLPSEIIEALEASDALAVELVMDTLEEQILEDSALLAAYTQGNFLPGGKTNAQLLSADMYELFRHAEKVLGDTVYNEMLYPSVVSGMLQYKLYDSSNRLFEEKGVDHRLIKLAREKGIDVIGIEEIYDRVGIDSRYPELAQILLIESALASSRAELIEGSEQMYELWCRGDEAALRQFIIDESASDTEKANADEIAAYEQYRRILVTERDAQMTEKAIEYLASEQTVFVAVGTMHVIGEGAMVDSLIEAGYTVELVEFK